MNRRWPTAEEANAMSDAEFDAIYGAWCPWTLTELADRMRGFDRPWWICGGQAIELFARGDRPHHDLDLLVALDDLPALRRHLADLTLWLNHDGEMRALPAEAPCPGGILQAWVKREPEGPWLVDLCLFATRDGRWICKRDPALTLPIEQIGWRSPDGIPCLRPELALLFKAKLQRPQDEQDFLATVPRLDSTRRAFLIDLLRQVHPESPWIERVQAMADGSLRTTDADR